jgi:hypothetical protein
VHLVARVSGLVNEQPEAGIDRGSFTVRAEYLGVGA